MKFKGGDRVRIVGHRDNYREVFEGSEGTVLTFDKYGRGTFCYFVEVERNKENLGGRIWYSEAALQLIGPKYQWEDL